MGSIYGTLETQMLEFLGNRDDASTKSMLMVSFNWFQNVLSKVAPWGELEKHVLQQLTATNVVSYVALDDGVSRLLLESSVQSTIAASYMFHLTTDLNLTDFRKFYSLKLFDGTRFYPPLDYVTPIRWDTEFASSVLSTTRKPTCYTIRGNYILFDCIPETGLSLDMWYHSYPTPVTSVISVIDYKSVLDPVMMCMAVGITWLGLEETDQSTKWLSLGSKMLKDFGVDGITVEHMKAFGATQAVTGSDYWKDPFVKGVR